MFHSEITSELFRLLDQILLIEILPLKYLSAAKSFLPISVCNVGVFGILVVESYISVEFKYTFKLDPEITIVP